MKGGVQSKMQPVKAGNVKRARLRTPSPFRSLKAVSSHARDQVKQPSLQCAQRGTMYFFKVTPPSMNQRWNDYFILNRYCPCQMSTSARAFYSAGATPALPHSLVLLRRRELVTTETDENL